MAGAAAITGPGVIDMFGIEAVRAVVSLASTHDRRANELLAMPALEGLIGVVSRFTQRFLPLFAILRKIVEFIVRIPGGSAVAAGGSFAGGIVIEKIVFVAVLHDKELRRKVRGGTSICNW
jgi:hypothetical protein